MNALFLTQSTSLDVFHDLVMAVREPLGLERVAFYVSDRNQYERFRRAHPGCESTVRVVKEWEIVERGRAGIADVKNLRASEARLGVPSLWPALVADRRVYQGRLSTLRQDYVPQFDHQRMLGLLESGIGAIERLFDDVRPDVVFSFICVTFGEYLAYLVARTRRIRFLNLRPTRVRNLVVYGETIFEPAERVRGTYEWYQRTGCADEWCGEARRHLDAVRRGANQYEGVIAPSRRAPGGRLSLRGASGKLVRLASEQVAYYVHGLGRDHHAPDWFTSRIYKRVLNPLRARRIDRALAGSYLAPADLEGRPFVFFPLHTEPEISLLVYSLPYLNQIEVVRTVAQSVPAGVEVVVKDHPASIGKRPLSYYRKLLQIPNVRLADPAIRSTQLIRHADAIVTIAGSIGLEALVMGKPVLTFGLTPYGFLPETMTRRVTALGDTANVLADLVATYRCDEDALERFIAATMSESAAVNLYSTLLRKPDVYRPDSAPDAGWQHEIEALAAYSVRCVLEPQPTHTWSGATAQEIAR